MNIPFRNPVIHDTSPSTFSGPYEFTDLALSQYKVAREKFGTTEVLLPNGTSFTVKDYQYKLADGTIGMRFIPVSDVGSVINDNKLSVPGASLIDHLLREEMQLAPGDPIYAYINYFHPEQNKGDVQTLLTKYDKIELGFTHLGAYYGEGYTTNAPMLYHNHGFGVDGRVDNTAHGYPANVLIISMKGVPQVTLNKNFRYVDTCLNAGVMFPNRSPKEYLEYNMRVVDINTALMVYRDWLRYEAYLKTDHIWYYYCAAHKTAVATVALNLPHNLKSFQEVYGDVEGKELFDQFKLYYNNVIGPDPGFLTTDETYFEPLWKQQGFTAAQISPFSIDEYAAYDNARRSGGLKNFTGKKPLSPAQATCWAPLSSAEMMYVFLRVYADMLDSGSVIPCACIVVFMDIIDERMGISKVEYLRNAMPIVDQLMIADARVNAAKDPDKYLSNTYATLCVAFGGAPADAAGFDTEINKLKASKNINADFETFLASNPIPKVIAAWALLGVINDWDGIIRNGPVTFVDAYVQMMESIQTALEKAREVLVKDPVKVEFYTPPTIAHLMSIGMHDPNALVTVRDVCTIVDSAEIQLKSK